MSSYEYRKLTPDERAELVRERLARGYPPHSPPHPIQDQTTYLLTGTCYEHSRCMQSEARRQRVLEALFNKLICEGIELCAWVVLPNHYHLLAHVPELATVGRSLGDVHRLTARAWNADDATPGRQVWYRYADRAIRSDAHYCVTLNYIHYNPVKHQCTSSPYAWRQSSVHWYLDRFGREWLRDLWARYPLRSYGQGWDEADL